MLIPILFFSCTSTYDSTHIYIRFFCIPYTKYTSILVPQYLNTTEYTGTLASFWRL